MGRQFGNLFGARTKTPELTKIELTAGVGEQPANDPPASADAGWRLFGKGLTASSCSASAAQEQVKNTVSRWAAQWTF